MKRASRFCIIFRSFGKEVFAANLYDLLGFHRLFGHPANGCFADLHFFRDLGAFRDTVFDQSKKYVYRLCELV